MARTLAATALAAMAVSGCGGRDDPPARTVTVESGATVTVGGDEYSFDPGRIVLRAAGSAEVRLTLRNTGTLAHNLRVFQGARMVGGTPTFRPGDSRSVALRLAPGSYRLVCTVGEHAKLGMRGTLESRPARR